MKNVILWELKRRRSALFWWTLASILTTVLILALYPSIRDKAHQLDTVINQLPQGLRGLKTGGTTAVDVADPAQFLNSQLFYATLPIVWIILAVTRGGSVLGRDEQDHTLELLLSRPISRSRLLMAKILAFTSEFAIVAGATLLAVIVGTRTYGLSSVSVGRLAAATILTALFSMSFGYVALALGAASRLTKRAATAVAVVLGFGGYVLASLAGLTDWLKWPVKFLPYHYFNVLGVLNGQVPRGLIIYLLGVAIIGSWIAFRGFRRRDIA